MSAARIISFACAALLVVADAGAARAQTCAPSARASGFAFAGVYPAIEGILPLTSFKRGMVVDIDPATMSADVARSYIKALQDLGARVSIYLVGGNCEKGRDCEALGAKVKLGATGSWRWDRSESRIVDITHRQVKERLAKAIVNGFELGANYIRIDNLHNPSGATGARTAAQLAEIIDLVHEIEDQMRRDGSIKPSVVTGVIAHNNLVAWEQLLNAGTLRRPPAFFSSERVAMQIAGDRWPGDERMKLGRLPATAIPEIEAGRRMAARFGIPYVIIEFRRVHDPANRDQYYALPQAFATSAAALPGVTEVMVMPREGQFVGRGEVLPGNGPRALAGKPLLGKVQPCASPPA
jgi:hypothetical protein